MKKRDNEDDTNLRDVSRGNWLATGKRRRRQRDPNAWESSIPTKYEHVLCLGMSYPERIKAGIRNEINEYSISLSHFLL